MRRGPGEHSRWIFPCAYLLEQLELRRMMAMTPYVIDGVQPAALDQPQTHVLFHRSASEAPLSVNDPLLGTSFDVQAFLDTGTSGMLLSQETAQGLGIQSEVVNGQNAVYSDVGVGGTETFDISEPLYAAIAPFTPSADVGNTATWNQVYTQKLGPIRTQIAQQPADELTGPIDIIGMPAMMGKVVVMDPKPVNTGLDTIRSYIYNRGTAFHSTTQNTDPGIPVVNRHIKLSYGSFNRFTQVTPGAAGPNLSVNPFIGPNPINKLLAKPPVDKTPPVALAQGKYTSTGSFLFDTGAGASFISTAEANNLHVHYKAGTYNTDAPLLVDDAGKAIAKQFQIPLGGIGGTLNAAGFYMDSLTLPTTEGQPITFKHAPVLVADISVQDPVTNQSLTLDGDFGMNYLVASADVSNGGIGAIKAGAFKWVTFDQPSGLLGLQLPSGAAGAAIPVSSTNYVPPGGTTTVGGTVGGLQTLHSSNGSVLTSPQSVLA